MGAKYTSVKQQAQSMPQTYPLSPKFPSSLFNISISLVLVLVLLLCDKNIQHTIYPCSKLLSAQYSIIDYGVYDVGSLGLIHCT